MEGLTDRHTMQNASVALSQRGHGSTPCLASVLSAKYEEELGGSFTPALRFPDVDTMCLVLDCSKPPKKFSQHLHWPNLFMSRVAAMGLVREIQLEAIKQVLVERADHLRCHCDGHGLPQFSDAQTQSGAIGEVGSRWEMAVSVMCGERSELPIWKANFHFQREICERLLELAGVPATELKVTENPGVCKAPPPL